MWVPTPLLRMSHWDLCSKIKIYNLEFGHLPAYSQRLSQHMSGYRSKTFITFPALYPLIFEGSLYKTKNSWSCHYLEVIQAQFLIGQHFLCFDIKNWKTNNIKTAFKRAKSIYEFSLRRRHEFILFSLMLHFRGSNSVEQLTKKH